MISIVIEIIGLQCTYAREKKEKNKNGERVVVNSESIEYSAKYYGSRRARDMHRHLTFSN